MFAYLRGRGIGEEHLQRIKVPAGLDIGATTPEEIALSIMAEIIQVRRNQAPGRVEIPQPPQAPEAIDPICGMTVVIATARHVVDYQGARFYFCSAPCKQAFEREPARYTAAKA